MIEVVGLMVAAYGIARLIQAGIENGDDHPVASVVSYIGVLTLVVLVLMLHNQATQLQNAIAGIGQ